MQQSNSPQKEVDRHHTDLAAFVPATPTSDTADQRTITSQDVAGFDSVGLVTDLTLISNHTLLEPCSTGDSVTSFRLL